MDLRRLRTFITVADQGTVSRAALRLHIAQPALSRQIKYLEEELGVRLFERVRRRLILTGEGEQLLADCRNVLSAINGLRQKADSLGRGDSGVLKVGATPQMIERVFSGFLHRYNRYRPKVQVMLSEAVGAKLTKMLERGEIHLAIGLKRAMERDGDPFSSIQLPPVQFLAASHAALDVGNGDSIDIARLARHPLLLLDPSFWFRFTFDAACRLADIKPSIFFESCTPHALLALAEARHGVAVVPSVVPTRRYRLKVMRITHHRKPLQEPLAVFWDNRRGLAPYAKDFCESLAEHAHELFMD